ncbi:uncharacterized protein LOC141659720 [Apium graveolens]|uniref:uncharacterized protein LOC141659720 n=1 Tax=Apium graveolens TaxID=4045 RepID=UPI003D7B600E
MVLDVTTSDHLPLILQLNSQVYMPKSRRFKFENIWIRDVECLNLIQNSWNTPDEGSILEKIEYCCLKLEEWGGGYLSNREKVQQVSEEQNAQLLQPISNEEVKEAVFSMHAEKAPGYDGLNPGFYQAYWNIIENDVVAFCQQFFETRELQVEFNHTLVCLISKRTQGVNGVAELKIDVSKAFTQYGQIFGDVRPQRGIRQGDPISPYLYILCAEALSSIIKRHEDVGLIYGCVIARGATPVSHLLFADDCYFFFKAVESEARVMRSIIPRYEELSGQAVNFNKSAITFSSNTSTQNREVIYGIVEVEESRSPGNYLGIPMAVGNRKNEVFNFLSG